MFINDMCNDSNKMPAYLQQYAFTLKIYNKNNIVKLFFRIRKNQVTICAGLATFIDGKNYHVPCLNIASPNEMSLYCTTLFKLCKMKRIK